MGKSYTQQPSILYVVFPAFEPFPLFNDDNDENQLEHSQIFSPFYDKFVDEYGIDTSRFRIICFIKLVVNCSNMVTLLHSSYMDFI